MSKQTMLRTPPSHLNVRSPLSNISNVIDIPNNSFQTPLPNMKLDSNGNIIWIMVIRLLYVKHVLQNYGKMNLSNVKKNENQNYSLCCGYGKVELPALKNAPSSYAHLFTSGDSKSKHFIKNIRSYNSMFSFTSMDGKIDSSINRGNAPYIFRHNGQNYHSIGSLLPEQGLKPKFSQLYIYDTDNEITNRQTCFGGENQRSTSNSSVLDNDIIQDLKLMLDSNNVLVQSYRMVRDCFHQNPHVDIKLRLIGRRDQDGRIYNLPSASEVAALIVGDIGDSIDNRDIVVQTSQVLYGVLVNYIHHTFLFSIHYCFHMVMMVTGLTYHIEFLVDAYTMIESERLHFIRSKQQILRCESYEKLRTQQNLGNKDISNVGQRVILPSSFTGGARYMMQNYLDAMSLCKWFGYPDFFITFTCNPKWPEVKRFLHNTSLNPEDRPDILCRLFKIKLDALIKDIRENKIFGIVQGVVYTIEFQKRGLPHCHICLFMHADSKRPTVEYIDPIISAEIPNINEDPELYSLVSEFMIHGPCGAENMNCPCMVDKQCSKNFPKQFCDHSSVDVNGYPLYMRRNNGYFVEKSGVKLDNRNVVPYNKYLLKRYQAHINVEWCNQGSSIKYLFKYINKGPDRATIAVDINADSNHEKVVDEIKDYYDCRYISACEASW
ncbi:uncharacterized protein LOC111890590 [Lactuca sativa]|uniref:uncharacterized protein LOC111890590 n=1 Tax=Lactuca sativa TaxID=4236 RepID=UPI0022B066BD|nr:uncharacterized protein LOC111890590 [Lactuca sativa]